MKEPIREALDALRNKLNTVAKLKTINRNTHWGLHELIYPPSIPELSLSQIDKVNKAREIELSHHKELDSFIEKFEDTLSIQDLTQAMEEANRLLEELSNNLKFEEDNLTIIFKNNAEWVGENLKEINHGEELKHFILEVSRFDYELRLAQSATYGLASAMTQCLEKYYLTASASQLDCPDFPPRLQQLDTICELIKKTDALYLQCKQRVKTHIQSAKSIQEIKQQYQKIINETKEAQDKKIKDKDKNKDKEYSEKKLIQAVKEGVISEDKAWIAAVTFDWAVKKMRGKQKLLEEKAKTDPNYAKANAIADNLCNDLQQLRHDYFDEPKIPDASALRTHYSDLILNAHTQLDIHRGGKKYVAKTLDYFNNAVGGCLPFFKAPRTDSHKKLDSLLQDLDAIDFPAIAAP